MIAKERPPALGWRVSSLGHVLGHAGLSDIDAELEEFSMDPRRSPQRIGNAHLADKLAYLRRYSWPATTAPRLRAAWPHGRGRSRGRSARLCKSARPHAPSTASTI